MVNFTWPLKVSIKSDTSITSGLISLAKVNLMATPNFKEGRVGFYHMLGRTTDIWRTALMTTTSVIY